jgi:hypothetical protein
MPDTSNLQLGIGEAIPQDEPRARYPSLPEIAVIEKGACTRIDGQEITHERLDARRKLGCGFNRTALDQVVKLGL